MTTFAELCWSQFWQVTCLVVIVAMLSRKVFRNRPHLSYLLWMLVVVKCLTPPIWSSPLGMFSFWESSELSWRDKLPNQEQSRLSTESLQGEMETEENAKPVFQSSLHDGPQIARSDYAIESLSGWLHRQKQDANVVTAIAIVWALGIIVLGGTLIIRWISFLRSIAGLSDPPDDLHRAVNELRQHLGMRRKIRIIITSYPTVPAAFGIWRPTIVIPQQLVESMDHDELKSVLAHELLHIHRWDTLAGRIQILAQVVWWMHPLVWWANAQVRRERERCCDQQVIALLQCHPNDYARMLVNVLEQSRGMRLVTGSIGMSAANSVSIRLEDIVKRAHQFPSRTPLLCWFAAFIMAAIVLPGAARETTEPSFGSSTARDDGTTIQDDGRDEKTRAVGAAGLSVRNVPPVVIRTIPASGDTKVDPNIDEISVTFSKRMMDGTWSWAQISDETFPEIVAPIAYRDDHRTCIAKVKLQPDRTYVIVLNSEKFRNFRDTAGQPAIPYLLVFETAAAEGD